MMLWILIAALTAAASLSVLIPMARARSNEATSAAADEAVYRQQLEEVDRDLERGLIDEAAAEAARTEIARRLLAANDRVQHAHEGAKSSAGFRLSQVLAVAIVPVAALGLYLYLGSPNMPDRPLAARLTAPPEDQSVSELVARAERHLAENPQDGRGWAVLAPIYMRLNNPEASANAYSKAIEFLGPSQEFFTNMGEALTMANEGLVTASAREAFEKAVDLEPTAVKPRFFLALALGQEGRKDDAISAWEALLEGADPTAFWLPAAREELQKLGGTPPTMAETLKGPNREQVEAASEMSAEDRQAMIQSMVDGLAARLASDGGTLGEWQRLIRAYIVLGDESKATAILNEARDVFGSNAADLAKIDAMAGELGLSGQ
ncbi:cytoChrome c-type biogenesis protein CycH [Roseibium sp. TrichSKD4]|uniref:c-type cytochrome biogenesis protein CcmI n=1 Tax=Roseibium sp. TrichSKD4 TaxID=744980 RepID=UPI0001E568EB|nr:c-type cytochrome biogenesis protein CcmI [Roseibium sp. TrichSKD4]EFO30570.1 cytoChrome c-type biogenesis protein CycH [Roseibium sp. TrichSKD4]